MSPPEIWGPAVWTLFHTLAEKVNEHAYPFIKDQLFGQIRRICGFLPCPECSSDATNFLAKINISDLKTKNDFRNTFYLFHNWVNAKKRKPLFNYSKLASYNSYGIVPVINNFISKYNTKGNMKLIAESFQRKLLLGEFKSWITKTIRAFVPPQNVPPPISLIVNESVSVTEEESTITTEDAAVGLCCGKSVTTEEVVVSEEIAVTEEVVSEATVTEEIAVTEEVISEATFTQEIAVTEEATVTEEIVNAEEVSVYEEATSTEEVVSEETVTEEVVSEETVTEEVVSEATVTEEVVSEATITEEVVQPKPKRGRKPKKQ
jgi:hypothetical protein